jgi:hypothetical protein
MKPTYPSKFFRAAFNFKIITFPNICSNIPASPEYGVYISPLIRYARASSNYFDFLKRHDPSKFFRAAKSKENTGKNAFQTI